MPDKVKPLKIEVDEDYGSYTEADPTEDYITGKGFSYGNSDNHLSHVIDNEIAFQDPINGIKKISDFLGTGLTAETHQALDQLVHDIAETSYYELTYNGTYTWRIDKETWYTNNEKTIKIREINYTYDVTYFWRNSVITITQMNGAGSIILTLTGTITYDETDIWKANYIDWVLT